MDAAIPFIMLCSSSAAEYILSIGMWVRASSSRPGFSYLVGVTDSVMSRFLNLSEAAS